MFSITGTLEFEPQLTTEQTDTIHKYLDHNYDDDAAEYIRDNKFILFSERPKYNGDTVSLTNNIASLEEIISVFLVGWSIKVVGKLSWSVTWNGIYVQDFLTLEVSEGKVVVSDERYQQEIYCPLVVHRFLQEKIARLEKENSLLKLELKYQPGGVGAQEAKEHFESLLPGI